MGYVYSLISSLGVAVITLIGVIISNSKSKAITDYKVDELTNEVRADRKLLNEIPVMRVQIDTLSNKLNNIEKVVKK